MNRPRIALVVDNPARDLDGLILLAKSLADQGAQAFLVPMYAQGFEVPAIAPDLVVLNYARPTNVSLIQAYSSAGIGVVILDTEGGVFESEEFFANSISHQETKAHIEKYCLWGRAQRDALLKYAQFDADQLVVTGCPRFDFYFPELRHLMQFDYGHLRPYVLMISSFALAYPRYTTAENEIKNMMEYGFDHEYAKRKLADEVRSRGEVVELLRRLASRFPSLNFVVRAHPFEDESAYVEACGSLSNVSVLRDGVVGPWVRDASLVLHLNSSVAVDSYLADRVALSLDWINTDIGRQLCTLSFGLSHKVKSEQELVAWCEKVLDAAGQVDVPKSGIDPHFQQRLEELFGPADGRSTERVTQVLLETIQRRKGNPDLSRCRKMALYGSRSSKSLKGWLQGVARLLLGARHVERLRSVVTQRKVRQTKELSLERARLILSRLVVPGDLLQFTRPTSKDFVIPTLASQSLCVSPAQSR